MPEQSIIRQVNAEERARLVDQLLRDLAALRELERASQKRTGIENRLSSKIRSSQAHKGADRDHADQERAVGDTKS